MFWHSSERVRKPLLISIFLYKSGSDTILKAMKRHYFTAEFRQTIQNIIAIFPNAAFGIDVIVGFPGETDELFPRDF